MKKHLLVLLLAIAAGCGGGSGGFQTRYKLTDLGTLASFGDFRALAINEKGEVVGIGAGATGTIAFVWRPDAPNGTTGVISAVDNGVHAISVARDINDKGDIVGYVSDHRYDMAAVWHGGICTLLGDPTGRSEAFAINSAGQVVGFHGDGVTPDSAVTWENGNVIELSAPGYTRSIASSINDSGKIVGTAYLQDGWNHNVVFTTPSDINVLGEFGLPPGSSEPKVNNIGQVVGTTNGQVSERGFVLGADGLQLWPENYPDNHFHSINDSGIIVGEMLGKASVFVGKQAIMLSSRTKLPSGYSLIRATDINNAGQIVGQMTTPTDGRAYLLTPIK